MYHAPFDVTEGMQTMLAHLRLMHPLVRDFQTLLEQANPCTGLILVGQSMVQSILQRHRARGPLAQQQLDFYAAQMAVLVSDLPVMAAQIPNQDQLISVGTAFARQSGAVALATTIAAMTDPLQVRPAPQCPMYHEAGPAHMPYHSR